MQVATVMQGDHRDPEAGGDDSRRPGRSAPTPRPGPRPAEYLRHSGEPAKDQHRLEGTTFAQRREVSGPTGGGRAMPPRAATGQPRRRRLADLRARPGHGRRCPPRNPVPPGTCQGRQVVIPRRPVALQRPAERVRHAEHGHAANGSARPARIQPWNAHADSTWSPRPHNPAGPSDRGGPSRRTTAARRCACVARITSWDLKRSEQLT